MDVLSKSEDMGVGLERRELVVADVYCLYASVGHKSAVDALQLITPLGANPNLGSRAKTTYERLKKTIGAQVPCFRTMESRCLLADAAVGPSSTSHLVAPKGRDGHGGAGRRHGK